ncbi:MAG: N-6 DNA methylase [Balneola sp.]
MLDTLTKKRIDDCRDILVGKLPDPKAQIEQITIGLIYKFMDDMDKEAVELGGKPKFFTDYTIQDPEDPKKEQTIEFEKYSWDNLFDAKVTATELLTLYSEAITKIDKNPNIPPLFRDIFKNAFLPYRDPETLKLFLKTIGEFEYTHSEKLGDAFEYLLSVMGSQGDAGQFRTPRHIIDFLVAIVDPAKNDTILDPACGTAGFLISAYKHILLKNTKENTEGLNILQYNKFDKKPFNNLGDNLTPEARKKLIQNFVGYDISPDMVRMSLVNLYLHGFSDPHIYEYDTLSSEARWNESFDVILANPPFMSPKGGIRPHKKFTISSNRSEVLFVDYIAEHLNPNGKAGIIVPEGIIFQSGKAYKELRKMLVENHLYAVISLPAGVFNPYSGVKTSILLMDKEVAKQSDEILFVKIDNDGFGLGAQRNAVKGGQLEEAVELIHEFVRTGDLAETKIAHTVSKAEIAKSGDYNLSGERYRAVIQQNSTYDYVELGEVSDITSSKRIFKEEYVDKGIPFYRTKEIVELNKGKEISLELYISKEKFYEIKEKFGVPKKGDILISAVGTLGIPWLIEDEREFYFKDGNLIWLKNISGALPAYIKNVLEIGLKNQLITLSIGAAYKALTIAGLKKLKIPLPPLSIQEEIVAEIEGYQKVIDGAKAVVENYKPHIDINPDWEMVELGEIIKLSSGKGLTSNNIVDGPYPVYGGNGINGYHNEYFLDEPTIVIGRVGAYCGAVHITEPKSWVTDNGLYVTSFLKEIELQFISQLLTQLNINRFAKVGGQPSISQKTVTELSITLPPVVIQRQIVTQIKREQELVSANKQLIDIFEQKIKDRIAKVWGEDD